MRGEWGVIFAVFFTLYDVAFTMQYWHVESNPIVLLMGPVLFVIVKLGLLLALIGVWVLINRFDVPEAIVMANLTVWIYATIMGVVAILNVIQIYGFRF